jgi:flagellin-specific chaperone FliS
MFGESHVEEVEKIFQILSQTLKENKIQANLTSIYAILYFTLTHVAKMKVPEKFLHDYITKYYQEFVHKKKEIL